MVGAVPSLVGESGGRCPAGSGPPGRRPAWSWSREHSAWPGAARYRGPVIKACRGGTPRAGHNTILIGCTFTLPNIRLPRAWRGRLMRRAPRYNIYIHEYTPDAVVLLIPLLAARRRPRPRAPGLRAALGTKDCLTVICGHAGRGVGAKPRGARRPPRQGSAVCGQPPGRLGRPPTWPAAPRRCHGRGRRPADCLTMNVEHAAPMPAARRGPHTRRRRSFSRFVLAVAAAATAGRGRARSVPHLL